MSKHNTRSLGRERGVAMVVALVLLVAATLTALFTNSNLVFGVKSQGNQVKSVVAQEAATAGIEAALAILVNKTNRENLLAGTPAVAGWYEGRLYGFFLDTDDNGTANTLSIVQVTSSAAPTVPSDAVSSFQVRFQRLAAPPGVTEADIAVRIDALGCADGQTPNATAGACTSRALLTQSTLFKKGLASAPSAALTAKGNVTLSGSVEITNTDAATNGTTIHSGGTYSSGGSADLVTTPGTPPDASVASGDTTLSSLSDDRFFQGFFGESKENVAADAVHVACNGPCPSAIDAVDTQGKVIWVDADPTNGAQINSNVTIGSPTEPVILIVDGPLQINGNVIIYGLVYCTALTWDNTGGGTSQIIGAAIAEGNFEATGTPNPTYDPDVLEELGGNLGKYVRIGGGWKDWCNDCNFTAW